MATFAEKLQALKAKSARLRQSKLEKLKETTVRLAEKTAKATFDAGKRLSMGARRRLSISSSRRSYKLEDKPVFDPLDNSMSTQDGTSGNRDYPKFEEEVSNIVGDNVRQLSDVESKEEDVEEKTDTPTQPQPPENIDTPTPAPQPKVTFVEEHKSKPKIRRPGLETKNWDPKTATHSRLHEALVRSKWDEAVWCISKGADIERWRGVLGETTLHEACMRRAPISVIKALVRAGAEVNALTTTGLSPLHSACMYNPSISVIEHLLKSGSRVNQQSKNGMTPIAAAAMQGRAIEVIALLLKFGANPRIIGSNYKTAKDYAKTQHILDLLQAAPILVALLASRQSTLPAKVLMRLKPFLY